MVLAVQVWASSAFWVVAVAGMVKRMALLYPPEIGRGAWYGCGLVVGC